MLSSNVQQSQPVTRTGEPSSAAPTQQESSSPKHSEEVGQTRQLESSAENWEVDGQRESKHSTDELHRGGSETQHMNYPSIPMQPTDALVAWTARLSCSDNHVVFFASSEERQLYGINCASQSDVFNLMRRKCPAGVRAARRTTCQDYRVVFCGTSQTALLALLRMIVICLQVKDDGITKQKQRKNKHRFQSLFVTCECGSDRRHKTDRSAELKNVRRRMSDFASESSESADGGTESQDNLGKIQVYQRQAEDHDFGNWTSGPLQLCSLRPPLGLQNLGNTWYFNAVMQNIKQTFLLEDLLFKTKHGIPETQKGWLTGLRGSFESLKNRMPSLLGPRQEPNASSLTEALRHFYTAMRSESNRCFAPYDLFGKLCQRSTRFYGGRQQDSHELLRHLMDGVKEEEKDEKQKSNNEGSASSVNETDNSDERLTVVDRVFGGHYLTVFHCHKCKMPYHLFEPFLDMSLPIAFEEEAKEAEKQSAAQKRTKNQKKRDKKEKSTDCDSALIPLLCVHG